MDELQSETEGAAIPAPVAANGGSGVSAPQPAAMGVGSRVLPSVEEILSKRAAGIKLTKAEAGRLAHVNRASRPSAQQNPTAPTARGQAVAMGVEGAGPGALPVPAPVDADLCKSTAGEILDTLNEAGLSSIEAKARSVDASPDDVDRFKQIASLKPGARTTMVNTAPSWLPKLLRVAGLNPENAPEAMAGVAAIMWGVGFTRASGALTKLQEQRERDQQRRAKPDEEKNKKPDGTESP